MAERDISDFLNPVLVKEIRQYFHNKLLHVLTWLLLGGQLVTLLMIQSMVRPNHVNAAAATTMYTVITACIVICGFLICGVRGVTRFATERADQELDFSLITPLKPARIILGKMIGALVMVCYLYALCLPFIVTAYFLRGLEMGQMLDGAAIAFPVILLAAQLGLLFGSFGRGWMVWIYCVAVCWLLWTYVISVSLIIRFGGMASSLFWGLVLQLLLVLLVCGFLFVSSVALISHPAANRMLVVRVYLAGIFLLGPILGLLVHWIGRIGTWQQALFWGILCCGGMAISCCATLAAFERDRAGWRVTRHCPRNRWGRWGYFLLSSGWGGGIVLAWVMLLVQGSVIVSMWSVWNSSGSIMFAAVLLSIFSPLYYIGVAEFAILLHGWIPRLKNWQWWLAIQAVCFIIGLYYGASLHWGGGVFSMLFSSGSAVPVNDSISFAKPILSCGFATLGLVLMLWQIRRQFAGFRCDALPEMAVTLPSMPGCATPGPELKTVPASEPVGMTALLPTLTAECAVLSGRHTVAASFGRAGDGWNCWTLSGLRQLWHNKTLLITGLGSVFVQLFLLYIHTQIPVGNTSGVITALLLTAVVGSLACLSQSFSRNKTITRKESPMLHRLDYSPFQGGALMWGLIQSHAILFGFFFLQGGLLLIYFLSVYPQGFTHMLIRAASLYLMSLNFMLLFATSRIRLDSLFCWIMLSLLFMMDGYFWKWDWWSGPVVILLMTMYLMEWFRCNLLSPSAECELRLRAGQLVLLGAGAVLNHLYPAGSMLLVFTAVTGAFGAIGSMGGYFSGAGGRRRSKHAGALWSDASSWGWLWAWAASLVAVWLLQSTDYAPWSTLIVNALCGGQAAFILASRRNFQIRRWNIDRREKVYAVLSISIAVAISLGIMLVALFGRLDMEELWRSWSYYGWGAAALLFVFIIPYLIADLNASRK